MLNGKENFVAREDAIRVKNFIRNPGSSHLREEGGDGPTPTQQASGSLDTVWSLWFPFIFYLNNLNSSSSLRRILVCVDMWCVYFLPTKFMFLYSPRKSICRYFGESIDENDNKILNMYCNQMCDVSYCTQQTRFSRLKHVAIGL